MLLLSAQHGLWVLMESAFPEGPPAQQGTGILLAAAVFQGKTGL